MKAQSSQETLVLRAFEAVVIVPTLSVLALLAFRNPSALRPGLALWAVTLVIVELLQLPVWRGTQLSMGFPILIAAALIFRPGAAALVAFVGSVDPREMRLEVTLLRALFNRSQVALSVLAASAVFHALGAVTGGWTHVLGAAFV